MSTLAADNPIICAGETCTVAELVERGIKRYSHWHGRKVALNADRPTDEVAAVLAARALGFELGIMPSSRFSEEWRARLSASMHTPAHDSLDSLREWPGGAQTPAASGALLLFTSGTSGEPRPVRYPFEVLNTFGGVHVKPHRWLMTYLSGTYAWIQSVMLCLHVRDQALVFPRSLDADDALAAMSEHGVTAVSSTPTFWRYLLMKTGRERLRALPIGQITLGGEHADQPILDALKETFPDASVAHTYATTESGFVFAVKDGRAGFPRAFVGPTLGTGARLRIEGGTLSICSPLSAAGDQEWIDSGDTVEVADDRVYIKGRKGRDVINVGGVKVSIDDVETFIRGLEGVAWARVYGVEAPVVGNLVAVDVVVDPAVWPDTGAAERALIQRCQRRFSAGHVPRLVTFLKDIPLTPTLKSPLF